VSQRWVGQSEGKVRQRWVGGMRQWEGGRKEGLLNCAAALQLQVELTKRKQQETDTHTQTHTHTHKQCWMNTVGQGMCSRSVTGLVERRRVGWAGPHTTAAADVCSK
jgi:hypothetical protein